MPDRVMLITGASRGIGAATARLAATRGYAVAVNYVARKDAAEAVAADVRKAGRKALTIQADIGRPQEIARLFQTIDAEFGRLDAFFNRDPQPFDVRAVAAAGTWNVVGGEMPLFEVTPQDAAFAQSTAQAVAEDMHAKLARVISSAPYVRKF